MEGAEYLGHDYDSSTTRFRYLLGDLDEVEVELVFSSPITGNSTMRQNLPASYVEVKLHGTSDIDVYAEVNGNKVPTR